MKLVDLDGMNIMPDMQSSSAIELGLDLESVEEVPEEHVTEMVRRAPVASHDWEDSPATASWGPLMQEVCVFYRFVPTSITNT